MVWRLKPDGGSGAANGALDPSFGTDGAVNLDTGGSDRALALAIQPDGRIVVAGQSFTSPDPNVAVVWRLTTGGGLDSSFDTDGVAAVSDGSDDNAEAVALEPDGKIVIAGSTNLPPNPRNAIVWRLKADGGAGALNGALDPTFDTDGQASVDGGGDDIARGVAVQPDGRIVIAGVAPGSAAVWRLLSGGGAGATNGALDPSFDVDGAAEIDGGGFASAGAVALQPDGKILVVGSAKATGSPFVAAVWRLAANGGSGAVNGALDPSFGVAGVATVSDSFGAGALALQPDRRIVVAGATSDAQLLAFRVLGDPFALNVATGGTGSGSVQSAPGGIACPASCSGSFDDGVGVTLTATAAGGSQFTGWSGAGCSGSGACTVSMTSDRTVTATFDAAQPQSKHFVLKASMVSMKRFRRSARKARALVNGVPPGTKVSAKLVAGRRALAKAKKTAGAAGRARLTFRFSRKSRKRLHSRKLKAVTFTATATPPGDTSSKASKRVRLKR